MPLITKPRTLEEARELIAKTLHTCDRCGKRVPLSETISFSPEERFCQACFETYKAKTEIKETHTMYKTDANGIILSPGKFEGEYEAVPYLYEMGMDGDAEWLREREFIVPLEAQDYIKFPQISRDETFIHIYESENGFVYGRFLTTAEYDALKKEIETEMEGEND